jgi:hypothetical protein
MNFIGCIRKFMDIVIDNINYTMIGDIINVITFDSNKVGYITIKNYSSIFTIH